MALSLDQTEPLEYAIMGTAGLAALAAVSAGLYTVPWRRAARGVPKATRSFNVLWHGRALLCLLSVLLALAQVLRVSVLWGANSLVLPASVTAWTGAGWMCRIYLTVALGVLQPLCAFLALLMLTAGLSRRHRPDALRHPNARLLGLAALCTLPVAAVQAVVAWLGLAVQYQGQPLEESPHSLLARFFATYWLGTPQQCGGDVDAACRCTLCTFPAAAVIAHGLFCLAFVAALWVTCARLAAAVLNNRLRGRMRLFQLAYSLLAVAGVAALGVSTVQDPFSWLNQGCWAAYVGTVALTVLLSVWEVAVVPTHQLRSVDKRMALWADATAAAFAAAGADEAPMGTQPSGGSSVLIKAHGRSADAEAYVQAAAAARTLSAVAGPQPPTRPPPLYLPPLPPLPPLSPLRQPSPLASPARPRQPLLSPQRQLYPSAPPLSPYRQAQPSAPPLALVQQHTPLRLQFPSAPPHTPQQLYP